MKKQLGWRLPRLLVDQFSELCRVAKLRPSESVEEFMRRVIGVGDVKEALNMIQPRGEKALLARELRARALIASIQGSLKEDVFGYDANAEYQELLHVLPMLQDDELIEEIKELSVQVNKALKT